MEAITQKRGRAIAERAQDRAGGRRGAAIETRRSGDDLA